MNTRNVILACFVATGIAAMTAAVILTVSGNGPSAASLLGFAGTVLVSLGGFFMSMSANQNAQDASTKTDVTNAKLDVVTEKVNGHMAALISAKTQPE